MEVHVRNVPQGSTEKSLQKFLKPTFTKLSIQSVHCQKPQGKTFATLTFLNLADAEKFLLHHGQAARVPPNQQTPQSKPVQVKRPHTLANNLRFLGTPIYCEKSRRDANPYLLLVLAKEEKDRQARVTNLAVGDHQKPKILPIIFDTVTVVCGIWNYVNSVLVYEPQLTWGFKGTAKFGEHSMILLSDAGWRIDFRYHATLCLTAEDGSKPSFFFSMNEPPRFFQKVQADVIVDLMTQLGLHASIKAPQRKSGPDRHRLPNFGGEHEDIAGSCLVYRVILRADIQATGAVHGSSVSDRMYHLRQAPGTPKIIQRHIRITEPRERFSIGFTRLVEGLSRRTPELPFVLKFQIQKLAQTGYLPPKTVERLLPELKNMARRTPLPICVRAVRKLFNQLPFSGPETEATDFELQPIIDLLLENEDKCKKEQAAIDVSQSSTNVVIIHRAKVTPTRIILAGPESEANNRVLRQYPKHHEYFLRVQFCDEDGEPVRFNPRISNEKIFHERFKNILACGINIAGRTYSFLGFSHSSLRAQSCWFMAPFILDNGKPMWDRLLVAELGNFTKIQSPAKCAARIGQVFSDTRTAVTIDPAIIRHAPDIESNGRVFSDGVGTMSYSVMKKIWDSLPKAQLIKPTLFQIRYQGAKGMISLDSRLRGDVLVLRPSMIKFDGSTWPDVEICEAAYKPLPMYLNRQLIKILEDMGVPDEFFLDLQAKEVQRLRMITDSPINASTFLKRQTIGNAIHIPWMISKLAMLNLDFRKDGFLRDIVETTLLMELRLLKHKTRIPVEKGWHLHGLMDETGLLEEGEIYCCVVVEGMMEFIEGRVIISRAPALHPGDVQKATAVIPPPGHPLRMIFNCICFSSKGSRDLPSQLSGGDLDGDRYYIMWDERGHPTRTFSPADYARQPPVDIGRPVEKADMTDFFIKFMESDQLGRIAVLHRIFADQKSLGTMDNACILLAEMHSTAVDFSKTGIPVDMSRLPKYNPWRPDFEAPGPHVKIEKHVGVSFEAPDDRDPDERGDEDDDFSSYRYYESEKILGKLYRAIDERAIFDNIKQRSLNYGTQTRSTIIDAVWAYVQHQCALIQWKHHLDWARDIRDLYEEKLLFIMEEFSTNPTRSLSELEAFIGNILGKTGAQSRHQRELSTSMKERFEEDSAFIVSCIIKDGDRWSEESLERSMACLAASLEDRHTYKRQDQLLSFKYVAAAVCLREVDRLLGI